MTTNKIEKQSLPIAFEGDKPIAILFRTKQGEWVWKKIEDLDEQGNVDLLETLIEINAKQNTKNNT